MPRVTFNTNLGYYGDLPPYDLPNGALVVAKDCYRHSGMWRPLPSFGSTATATCTNIVACFATQDIGASLTDVDTYLFAATTTSLYRYKWDASGTKWDGSIDMSPAVTSTASSRLSMSILYGDFMVYGGADPWVLFFPGITDPIMKCTDIGGAAAFSTLTGSPVYATTGILFRNHLITAGLKDYPKTVQISAYNDITSFSTTFNLNTGASMETFNDQGMITGLANLVDSFAIFHENDISLGWWTGHPNWISFKKGIIKGIGAMPGTVVPANGKVYFWGRNNAYVLSDQTVEPIGTLKVAESWIANESTHGFQHGVRERFGYHWSAANTIIWGTKIGPSPAVVISNLLFYNYEENTWSYATDINVKALFEVLLTGGQMELGGFVADAIPARTLPQLFNNTPNKTMVLRTGELSDPNGQIIEVQRVRPKQSQSGAKVAVRIGTRMLEDDTENYCASASRNAAGYCDILKTGRFVRAEVNTDYPYGSSIDVDYVLVGDR